MHIISFMFKSNPQVMQFHYDTEKDAERCFEQTKNWSSNDGDVKISDDYGSSAVIRASDIAGVFLTDLAKEANAMRKKMITHKKVEMAAHKEAMGSAGNIVPGLPS